MFVSSLIHHLRPEEEDEEDDLELPELTDPDEPLLL